MPAGPATRLEKGAQVLLARLPATATGSVDLDACQCRARAGIL
jgi:hypothetical protein